MIFQTILFIAAAIAAAIATITGFGIGSILTPLLAVRAGTQLAVAAVSIPHFFATALRFWRLRAHVDRRVLVSSEFRARLAVSLARCCTRLPEIARLPSCSGSFSSSSEQAS